MKKPFTLVELLIAMSVLSVFLLGLMQFYTTTEDVMSAGANRTELFERARVAMDMMANDITCMYYSQTDKSMTPFKSTGISFAVATVRPEKLLTSAKTSIVGAQYRWDSGSRKLIYASDGKDVFSVEDASFGGGETLVEGVTDFSVTANTQNGANIPDSVLIRMELVDGKTLKRLEANAGSETDILKAANKREFRRLVIVDRGQRKIKE